MSGFAEIRERAERRKGGAAALAALLPALVSAQELAATGDDRFLAAMARCINQAGFSWRVIDNKWPEFEDAFHGFDPVTLGLLSPEQWEAYANDRRVVRNWQKIQALRDNVFFVQEIAREHGGFGPFLAAWPAADQIGLLACLKERGARLGGNTGQWFLRRVGKDGFVLTRDVIAALRGSGLEIAAQPTSKRDLSRIQDCFNRWQEETGLPYSHLSRIAACSVGENYR